MQQLPAAGNEVALKPQTAPAPTKVYKSLRPQPSPLKQILQCFTAVALGLMSYLLISHFLVQSVKVVGSSMTPTLHNSEYYLLNRWIYHFRQPRRADVVVIRDPTIGCYSVKRVIGVAGDSVYFTNGMVYVNGRKLDEPYLSPGTPTYTFGKFQDELIVCGKNQYFLLGDNRMNSADSRTYGPVSRGNILGMLVR